MGSIPTAAPSIRVLIAGGSYCGLSAALNLRDLGDGRAPRMAGDAAYEHHPELPQVNFEITLVDERDGYYHLIGSPLAFADSDYAKKAWVRYQDMPAIKENNIRVLHGSVSAVDVEAKSATVIDSVTKLPSTHEYDYFVAATGLRRVFPTVPQSLTRKQYLLETEEQIHAVANARDGVLIVGGGAVGIEMAAELKMVKPHVKVTLAHSRAQLLSSEDLSDECKDKALELVHEAGVETLMEHRLASSKKVETTDGSSKYEVEFTNGHKMVASQVVVALSKHTPTTSSYFPASAVNADGLAKIQPSLRLLSETANSKYHYAGGDAAEWTGIKRAGGAMHMGHYIAHNIHQTILADRGHQEAKLQELTPFPAMIGLAVGKKAVASGPEGTVSGEDVCQAYFRNDLGFDICYEYMQLGGKKGETVN